MAAGSAPPLLLRTERFGFGTADAGQQEVLPVTHGFSQVFCHLLLHGLCCTGFWKLDVVSYMTLREHPATSAEQDATGAPGMYLQAAEKRVSQFWTPLSLWKACLPAGHCDSISFLQYRAACGILVAAYLLVTTPPNMAVHRAWALTVSDCCTAYHTFPDA